MNDFDDLDDLDDVFGPLRSSARPAELLQERATVDLMVNAHRTAEGKHMFASRRARIATLVAAGVLGFGGMAAASPSLGGDEPPVVQQATPDAASEVETNEPETDEPETDEPETDERQPEVEEPAEKVEEPAEKVEEPANEVEEPVTVDPDSQVVPAGDPLADPDETTAFNESYCADGNHGKTVSAVARGDVEFLEKYKSGTGGTPTVTDAAHSSCGKTDPEPDIDEKVAEPEIDEREIDEKVDEPEVEVDEKVEQPRKPDVKPERPGKGADGPGNGKSNGNGNGKRGG